MRLDALFLLAASFLVGLAANCGAAQASSSDATSTKAYLQANHALLRAASSQVATAEMRLRAMLLQVRRECPAVAAESPQNHDSKELANEVIGVMVLNVYHLDLPAAKRFMRAVGHLRWSDARVTRAVRRYAGKLRTLSRLAIPSVCADVQAWVATGYRTLPAGTVLFDQRFFPAWVGVGELPSTLTPFERPDQKSTIKRLEEIKSALADHEARAVVWWGKIAAAMGLN
jgi:hypothetical protein